MARYTGPVCRICRRFGDKLFLKGDKCFTKCTLERRSTPPGMRSMRRRRISERGTQLREKQKARYMYGILERQFRRYFAEAGRRPGLTGENLVSVLEMRMDNVVYRLGLADSRAAARQLVLHGHLALNGRPHNIPSALLRPGDEVSWRESARDKDPYKRAQASAQGRLIPPWLNRDPQSLTGRVLAPPARSEIEARIDERLIVEYYSR